ncbi:TetR/AcrR family transcriptional regulator [Marinicella sp. S1101]|uniref:TetR/AcrR family transcriptional regulator n=1 Tax=Marinicella marina TaxID=2996016 RepID=UPI0022608BE5|nr:TetR/AcrR family transcriptional regulator [Marinicella marina]MCX7554741.1 TetR/AcrR family transcriptional regulator [Marinicella marina]MDJ1141443.1 TetR/AcrR family transcriptional regulator [Marinicella marina]
MINLSYETFNQDFNTLIGDEWSCLFDLNHQKLNLKNRNIATKKFKLIIETVFKLSNEKGFQAMTMRDLSQESGISMGGLYKYFSNKTQIVEMIHAAMVHMAATCLHLNDEHSEDPIFELNELLARHIYISERLKKWFYFVFMEAKCLERPLVETIIASEQAMEDAILKRIVKAKQQNFCQCTNPDFVAAMLKVMLQEWYLKSWKYIQKDINADQYVANLLLSVYQLLGVKS